jgi:uncharacterized protein YegP (UPF0339 family)
MAKTKFVKASKIHFEVYPTIDTRLCRNPFWKWRAKHENGTIIAESEQSYTRKLSCKRAINRFVKRIHLLAIIIES